MFDWKSTSRQIDDSDVTTALFPVGSVEQHGRHLPVGTDWRIAAAVAEEVGRREGYFVIPVQPYGTCLEQMEFNGSITLRPATLIALTQDVIASLVKHGFEKIIVLSMHGGNFSLGPAVREARLQHPGVTFIYVDASVYKDIEGADPDEVHAGEVETSLMLHLEPGAVGDERIDCVPETTPAIFNSCGMKSVSPDGVWGRPSLATAKKGKEFLGQLADAVIARIRHTEGVLSDTDEEWS